MSTSLTRRSFLRTSGLVGAHAVVGSSLFALGCDATFYGPLEPADENGIRLPPGFHSRIVARTGDLVAGSGYAWHSAPDGGAVFGSKRGWVYVSNSERTEAGGVGAIRFDANAEIMAAYPICTGTRRNCAGGATPWRTWLTCEEVNRGLVYECDPKGLETQRARPALGSFKHEAVAVDSEGRFYLTEDERDGRLYRFTPNAWRNLDAGVLEVARVDASSRVYWHTVPNPNPGPSQTVTRRQVPASTRFNGGEGIVYQSGHVYFATKGDDRVWDLDLKTESLHVLYERRTDTIQALGGVDNVGATRDGDLVVAEDGGNMELVMLSRNGLALPLLRVTGQPFSELAGQAFDPSGTRLYFSSQRGSDGRGITYEVSGPFRRLREDASGSATAGA